MNLCYLIGKIISDIEFKFIINDKNYTAIAIYELELLDKNRVIVHAYNKIADYSYQKLKQEDYILIEGCLETEGSVEVKEYIKI